MSARNVQMFILNSVNLPTERKLATAVRLMCTFIVGDLNEFTEMSSFRT